MSPEFRMEPVAFRLRSRNAEKPLEIAVPLTTHSAIPQTFFNSWISQMTFPEPVQMTPEQFDSFTSLLFSSELAPLPPPINDPDATESESETRPPPPSHLPPSQPHKRQTRRVKVPEIAKFQCQTCHTFLISSSHLSRHMRTHWNIKPYLCKLSTCNRRFARRDNMMQHYASHFREKSSKGRKYKVEVEEEWEMEGGLEGSSRKESVKFWEVVRERVGV